MFHFSTPQSTTEDTETNVKSHPRDHTSIWTPQGLQVRLSLARGIIHHSEPRRAYKYDYHSHGETPTKRVASVR